MTELNERRTRARCAYYDNCASRGARGGDAIALDEAIESATQVRVTDDIMSAAINEIPCRTEDDVRDLLAAAFRAAGFEVIE